MSSPRDRAHPYHCRAAAETQLRWEARHQPEPAPGWSAASKVHPGSAPTKLPQRSNHSTPRKILSRHWRPYLMKRGVMRLSITKLHWKNNCKFATLVPTMAMINSITSLSLLLTDKRQGIVILEPRDGLPQIPQHPRWHEQRVPLV